MIIIIKGSLSLVNQTSSSIVRVNSDVKEDISLVEEKCYSFKESGHADIRNCESLGILWVDVGDNPWQKSRWPSCEDSAIECNWSCCLCRRYDLQVREIHAYHECPRSVDVKCKVDVWCDCKCGAAVTLGDFIDGIFIFIKIDKKL